MKQLTITITIEPSAAVREGRTQVGDIPLVLSDSDLSLLSQAQRDALARHVGGEAGWGERLSAHAEPVASASIEALAQLLDQRIDRMERLQREAEEREKKNRLAYEVAVADARAVPIQELDPMDSYPKRLSAFAVGMDWPARREREGEFAGSVPALVAAGREEEARRWAEQRQAELEAKREAERQAKIEREAEQRAELVRVLERRAPQYLEVFEAGFLDQEVMERELHHDLVNRLEKLGSFCHLVFSGHTIDTSYDGPLTPEQLRRWKQIQQASVDGVEFNLASLEYWRPSTPEDDFDTIDEDDEVKETLEPVVSATDRSTGRVVRVYLTL